MEALDLSEYDAQVLKSLLQPFLRKSVSLTGVPLTSSKTLSWHLSVEECRRLLRQEKAHGHDLNGFPSARIRWSGLESYASLEFVEGAAINGDWLTGGPELVLHGPEGTRCRMKHLLRAANLSFPTRNPRGNWNIALNLLGSPNRNEEGGVWLWDGEETTVRFTPAGADPNSKAWLRLEAKASARTIEIRNQSPLELFDKIRIELRFSGGKWRMGDRSQVLGVPVRLHWDAPRDQELRLWVEAGGKSSETRIRENTREIVLASDGNGGVRTIC